LTPQEFAEARQNQPYKMITHAFGKRRFYNWSVCDHCSLIRYRNELTDWAVSKGCDAANHPDAKRAKRMFAKR